MQADAAPRPPGVRFHDLDANDNLERCADCQVKVPKQFKDEGGSCDRCTLFHLDSDLGTRRPGRALGSAPTDEEDLNNTKELRILLSTSIKLLAALCRYLGRRPS